jgi:translation initiation factor 1A
MKDKRAKENKKSSNKEPLQLKTEGTDYAQIIKMLGGGRVDAKCFSDGVVRQCTICGRMRKKIWISVGDIVLVSLRDFQDHKGDVVHKYAPDESRQLKTMGEIPSNVRVNEVADVGAEEADNEEDTDDFDFDAI